MNPTISVLMPVYDAERYLREAMASVLAQTFTDFELIAVDDGSSDGSLAILLEFERRDPRVRVISRPNTGIVGALNDGLAEGRGEFIARMDADDVCLPERLAVQADFLRNRPDLVAVGSNVVMISSKNAAFRRSQVPVSHEEIVDQLLGGNSQAIVHPAAMIRSAVLRNVRGYREEAKYVEDVDLFLRLGEVGQLGNVEATLLRYRVHASSTNATRASTQRQVYERVLRDAFARRNLVGRIPNDLLSGSVLNVNTLWPIVVWGALTMGDIAGARREALGWVLRRPFSKLAWKGLACAVRGK